MPLREAPAFRASVALAVVLTCVAGFVDTVGYVALFRVFTANMTGNTIAIALGGVEQDVATALRRGFAIPMFVLGLVTCRLLVHMGERREWRRLAGALFALEAVLLGAFIAFGYPLPPGNALEHEGRFYLLVALPAFAMGLQNAALTHVGPLTIRTTHVTGNLATLGDHAAKYLIWLRSRSRAASLGIALAESGEQRAFRRTVFLTALWTCYLAGALGGAYFYSRGLLLSLIAPIVALLSLVAVDAVRPIFRVRRRP